MEDAFPRGKAVASGDAGATANHDSGRSRDNLFGTGATGKSKGTPSGKSAKRSASSSSKKEKKVKPEDAFDDDTADAAAPTVRKADELTVKVRILKNKFFCGGPATRQQSKLEQTMGVMRVHRKRRLSYTI
jgi:hypothetical protein